MSRRLGRLIERVRLRQSASAVDRIVARLRTADMPDLRDLRGEIRRQHVRLTAALRQADLRLGRARVANPPRPPLSDWAWRPDPFHADLQLPVLVSPDSGAVLAEGIRVFHDGRNVECALRQSGTARRSAAAPFGLALDMFGFDGSYISISIDLPHSGLKGLSRRHVVRLETVMRSETAIGASARLNVRHGPNTDHQLRDIAFDNDHGMAEFDLGYTEIDEARIEKAWIDLILSRPAMTRIEIMDLVLSRYPRAEI
ncbi:hypothetical protein LV82_00344 [Albidovulum inexpectatum]|uniref:Uncharacterized protein n=1 Tax=Albidovulum inexpectatum TaxID=196587 RepID=A0A2S5JLP8_9RHOB|nr:DUF6478 family protein [Albidovulum inexpectatum]PPB82414.1 hypothetical protein LV82_00344 [Albidovulum inexpectatum]